MADRVSALAGHDAPRRIGRDGGEPGVRISERRLESLWLISAWPGRLAQAGRAAAAAAGAPQAPAPCQSVTGSEAVLLRTEPMKCLMASARPLPRPAIAAEDGAALDLSHARTVIRVVGPAMREVLARLVPLDLRSNQFPKGAVAGSGIHHVGVTLHHRDGGVDIYVPRSFGLAIWEEVLEAAAQFGAEVSDPIPR